MKIAMIGQKRIPGREGGVEVVVEELAVRYAKLGIDVVAYNRKKRGDKVCADYQGVHLVEIPAPDSKKMNAVVYSYLATIHAIFSKVDLIHYHALGPAASLWLAKLFNIKVVVTVHGLNYITPKWKGIGDKYIRFGEKVTANKADEVIVLSRSIQEYFMDKYGRDVIYIPNGISMPEVNCSQKILRIHGLNKDGYILCVARLVPGKGLETLIEAFENIETDLKLVIAGDSEYVDSFKKSLVEMASRDKRIIFTGFVEKEDLATLYTYAALFVFPSEAEGMPMSLLEAMWYGCPCLTSDIPENTEVLEGLGYTFRVKDREDLQDSLSRILENRPIRIPMSASIKSKHNWDNVAKSTISIYTSAIAIKRAL